MNKYENIINEMEQSILDAMAELEPNYGYRKRGIVKRTGIPEDILTVLLKRLKYAGRVEIIMIWDEYSGRPDGSGYCLTKSQRKLMNL